MAPLLVDTHARLCPGASPADLAAHRAAFGADEIWLRAIPGQSADCVARNDAALALMAQDPRLKGFCALHPAMGNAALAELDRCLDSGMLGAGDVDPIAQGFALEDPAFHAIARRLQERGAILALHLGFSVGAAGETYPIRVFAEFIHQYPGLKVILTNYGGGLPFYELMKEVNARLSNVLYDTAPGPRPLRQDACEITAMITGYHKLVYGSGAPIGACISASSCQNFPNLGITDSASAAAVAQENALRLTGRAGA